MARVTRLHISVAKKRLATPLELGRARPCLAQIAEQPKDDCRHDRRRKR
jgi:hypothetical protein